MAGTGKRTKLLEALQAVAAIRKVPFHLQFKKVAASTSVGDVEEAGATEEGAGPQEDDSQFQHESSFVHMGLDIARMSMQDKHILRPILAKLGQGSQVMAGEQGRGARILVLYHAHLLSSESVLLLQACLEQNEGDLSIWLTSELPVPQRIRDWFLEVPVSTAEGDRHLQQFQQETGALSNAPPVLASWPMIFHRLIDRWLASPAPVLQDLKQVKAFVYEMLMRNLRWVEATHFLLDAILEHPTLSMDQRRKAIQALALCEATAGGYTIPSYRIPILWEHLFLKLRAIFSQPELDVAPPPKRASRGRSSKVAAVATV
jgi:hypothetical protein